MDTMLAIQEILPTLDSGQLDLVLEIARAMGQKIEQHINPQSDILSPAFVGNFSNRLIVHHATHEEKFKKKAFEYAFCAASRSAERSAEIVSHQTNPGADVIVDGVNYSLKTEAAADIHPDKITISKLMEARWIRECKTEADFAGETTKRVTAHLEKYQRILTLRAFDLSGTAVRYDLVEIPLGLLLELRKLTAADFSRRTANGGSGAQVKVNGQIAFKIRLDGSVEKVTISSLLTRHCVLHGSWTVPVIGKR